MAAPRLRILSVGGNAVSAFLSWRLQATNACDVTLVWKSGFEQVSQYGISFKSKLFGNERFKPLQVVRTPEEAGGRKAPFDYVLLCVKALPDVYDLAAVIESVVTPQHTCILVNTTHTLGVEAHLEERFPTNVVLSLVSGAEIIQLGPSEFEHTGSTEIFVGPANKNPSIPVAIQNDMAQALAMTLSTGQVDCRVSENIRQQQYERMIGPIAFHPISVLLETPAHIDLIEKTGIRSMISDTVDELIAIARYQECDFPADFKEKTIANMLKLTETNSIMYQDFMARRPMEVETYLGSPIQIAQTAGLKVPRIETLYALLHNFNILNQNRPTQNPTPPQQGPGQAFPPRMSSASGRPPMNGAGRGRTVSMQSMQGPPRGRGGPMNGYGGRGGPPNGYGRGAPGPNGMQRPPMEDGELGDEFSHLVLYDDIPEGEVAPGHEMQNGHAYELALRERELMLRQREMQLREQEYSMRRGPPPRQPPPQRHGGGGGGGGFDDDDDDDDDFFDPMASRAPMPQIDADNFDMMSVTSRRNRKAPSQGQIRNNPEMAGMGGGMRQSGSFFPAFRPGMKRNRGSSQRLLQDIPQAHQDLMSDPMMGYSSNRYGTVDRKVIRDDSASRAGSLTRERLMELQGAGNNGGMNGAYPSAGPGQRRASLSPGNGYPPNSRRVSGRPSPPHGDYLSPNGTPNGMHMNGGPSPPGAMRQPVPRHPPGQGNAVAPQQVEQYAGVSNLHPLKGPQPPNVRSLTGSASASAGSGDSANIDSEPSAHSSQSSFGPRPPIGVR